MFSIHCNSCIQLQRNKKGPQRTTKIKSFINKCNCEVIIYPSGKKWLEKNWEK